MQFIHLLCPRTSRTLLFSSVALSLLFDQVHCLTRCVVVKEAKPFARSFPVTVSEPVAGITVEKTKFLPINDGQYR